MKIELSSKDLNDLAKIVQEQFESTGLRQIVWESFYDSYKKTGEVYTERFFTEQMARFALLDGIEAMVEATFEKYTTARIESVIQSKVETYLSTIDLEAVAESYATSKINKAIKEFRDSTE